MTSLSRVDAHERAASISVGNYAVRLDLTQGGDTFGSASTVSFTSDGSPTWLDVAAQRVVAATLNGRPLDLDTAYDPAARRLALAPQPGGNEVVVEAVMRYSSDGEGLHRHVDPADGSTYLYAMSFLDAAPRWFACFDQPDLKAPLGVHVSCPPEWRVAGNGPATQDAPGQWRIAATQPLPTYAATVVAGPYHQVRDEHDGIPLVLHVRRSLAGQLDRDADELFAHTKRCLDELHRLFQVRYPWGEYHQAFVPDLTASAMENPGCVTLGDAYIHRSVATDAERLDRAVTMAHEMAHMWFGDLVTMRWWDDLWLNESFAEYLGNRITGEHCWADFGITRKGWGYAADRRPSTHPVAANGARDAASALSDFDGISYAKGASALRQLAIHLGDDVFLDGLRRYIATHAHGNAEFADLLAAWTDAGAADLPAWTQAWLRTSGMDELAVEGGILVRRTAADTPRPHTISVGRYDASGATLALDRVDVNADRTPLGSALQDTALVLADALDETWAKLVLPHSAWQRMPTLLPGLTDARSRAAVWNALLLAVADAQLDPALAVDIAVAALPAEADESVLATVGRWTIRRLGGDYLTDPARRPALTRLATALLDAALLDTPPAAPSPGWRLTAVRLVVAATYDVALLQSWLAGVDLPPQIDSDADLRWAVLTRLAELGALSAADVDAELARDRSSQGVVHAARCRAALPDAAAKAAAWEVMLRAADRPVQELYATAEGFWQPDQREFTDAYVERYFTDIAATAAIRTGWVVEKVAGLAYPSTAVEAATLDATAQLLARDDLDAGIRRAVVDAGDDLRRAVVVRMAFGSA